VRRRLTRLVERVRAAAGRTPAADPATSIEYRPERDGAADPGEVVWAWVPYEDDPSRGKDRPVAVIGRRGSALVGVALTTRRDVRRERSGEHAPVGTGAWDRERRPSWAKLDRVLDLDPARVRREGAALDRRRFDALVAALRERGLP